jgi:hypothetical protein
MITKLTQELADAVNAAETDGLEVVDPTTNRTYVIVDGETHLRAMDALRRVQDVESIQRGAIQADAGEGIPLAEADQRLRSELGFESRAAQ